MSRLEVGSRLIDGWLGAVFSGVDNGETVRITPLAAVSSSLVADLEQRSVYSKIADAPYVLQSFGINDTLLESYWVSQNVDGYPLGYLFQRGLQIPVPGIEFIVHSVRKTLMQSYKNGVVHGDLHPNLVYLDKKGGVWIDGMGRLESNDTVPRTGDERYFAPEVHCSLTSDIYSLGVMALELYLGRKISLAGRLATSHEVMVKDFIEEIDPEDHTLRSFFSSALQYDPRLRQQAVRFHFQAAPTDLERWCQVQFKKLDQLQFFLSPSIEFETTQPMDALFDIDEFDDLELTHDFTDEITQIQLEDELTEMTESTKKVGSEPNEESVSPSQMSRKEIIRYVMSAVFLIVFALIWAFISS
ncbi:MAG: hypothetical protein VX278_03790 [Myxococcota bacterium]|nr:hypothetical protein [Myxococcota bacterium]